MNGCLKWFFIIGAIALLVKCWYIVLPIMVIIIFVSYKFKNDNVESRSNDTYVYTNQDYDAMDDIEFEQYCANIEKQEDITMYDKEKGIYPSGCYLVGSDIPLGGYILTAKNDETGYVQLYPSYAKFKKEEDEIIYQNFVEDFHISLMEEKTFLVVENADMHKI